MNLAARLTRTMISLPTGSQLTTYSGLTLTCLVQRPTLWEAQTLGHIAITMMRTLGSPAIAGLRVPSVISGVHQLIRRLKRWRFIHLPPQQQPRHRARHFHRRFILRCPVRSRATGAGGRMMTTTSGPEERGGHPALLRVRAPTTRQKRSPQDITLLLNRATPTTQTSARLHSSHRNFLLNMVLSLNFITTCMEVPWEPCKLTRSMVARGPLNGA